MGRQRWQLWLAIVVLTLSGCAHVPPRQRLTRALIATGVAVAVTGGVISAGCLPDDRPGACSASRDERSFKIGLPIFALGLAIITGALLLRPPAARPPTPKTTRHATPAFNDPYGPPPLNGY